MMLLAYALSGLGILLITLLYRSSSAPSKNNFLSWMSILHALLYLAFTIILASGPLPQYYFPNQYMFVDSLGVYEVLISSGVFLLSAIYARGYIAGLLRTGEIRAHELKLFYSGLNLLFIVVVFAFFSNSLALFWIFLELTTVLSAVLIVTLNAKENIVAALKYLFTASTAMLFSIIGLIILFAMTREATGAGTLNWDILFRDAAGLSPGLFTFCFVFIFIGFAAKAGIVPFHTWLPQAHAKAPSVISVMLSAVLLNIGVYGILRVYAIGRQTQASDTTSIILIVFGTASVALAAFSMLPRTNIKKLIAFSSIENMGFILIGIGLGSAAILFWVLFYTLAHALIKTLLFFSAGILHQQYGGNKFERMENALKLQPLASFGMIAGSVAIIGAPLFPAFVPKLLILTELGSFSLPLLFIILALFLIVAAGFAVILVRTFSRVDETERHEIYEGSWTMKAPIILLSAGVLFLGVYLPEGLRHMLDSIVTSLGY